MLFAMNLMIVPGMFVCSSFLISVCMFLSELLDKHAPLKNITVVDRPLNEWMTNNILALKASVHKKNNIYFFK